MRLEASRRRLECRDDDAPLNCDGFVLVDLAFAAAAVDSPSPPPPSPPKSYKPSPPGDLRGQRRRLDHDDGGSSAAVALGLSGTTAEHDGHSGVNYDPPWCYFEDGELKFNSEGAYRRLRRQRQRHVRMLGRRAAADGAAAAAAVGFAVAAADAATTVGLQSPPMCRRRHLSRCRRRHCRLLLAGRAVAAGIHLRRLHV